LLKNLSNLFFWLAVKPFRVGGIDEIMVNIKENIKLKIPLESISKI